MPTIVHEFAWPDRVVVGTVGLPGSRRFYLQARTGAHLISIGLDKQHAAVLADAVDEMLDELRAREGNPFGIPTDTPIELVDNEPLEQPLTEEFTTGAMSLVWDPSTVQIVIEAHQAPGEIESFAEILTGPKEPQGLLLVRMPVGTARAFAKRTHEVVGAGRPLCPLCGSPIDPDGHVCSFPDGP
ncbi:DUF3090 family protein [Cryobacterium sp. TMT1-21]|uniref:DUF3090 family protein n=1 Tax=Cryobacterium shii TaxID=1259235 RepID=A0AAQ2C5F8_9MICO|nr:MULTISPECIES: DUF3090 family protein [Cryobacterium]TFC44369.1 DUF3090 family protein [Cryobacterium shii]TFC88439.1 DUF3090 family protein [Cryobacterium sp. TmT2-59]TFD17919.1 DUF3090 family protein [Cryobacterium sp. TMT1-21]TFD35779.1 DUF3090 family protein [Cryobacterium sp. TMT2-10]